jgi:hypothetical protein
MPVLKKYNLTKQMIVNPSDITEKSVMTSIELSSLEELDKLSIDVKCPLVLLREFEDIFQNTHCLLALEIYDAYRE